MGRRLATKQNVDAPSLTYTFGRIRNNPGNNSGTPFDESLYGDIQQFMEKMFDASGLVANNLPDNDTNGYQFFQALQNNIYKYKSIISTLGTTSLGYDAFGSIIVTTGGGVQTLPPSVPGDNNDGRSITIHNPFNALTIVTCAIGNIIYGCNVANTIELGPGDTVTITQLSVGTYYVTNKYTFGSGTKVIPIGDWNMNTTATKTVAHGLTLSKIRSISVVINIDTSALVIPLVAMINTTPGGSVFADPTNINLFRFSDAQAPDLFAGSLSAFANANYQATSFNRGWITIEYAG